MKIFQKQILWYSVVEINFSKKIILFHLKHSSLNLTKKLFQVLQETTLWEKFEIAGRRPFPGAIILGDSAYPLRDWLISPFPGDPEGAKLRFNVAHIKTRNTIERCFGVLKNRFYSLKTGLRVKDMEVAGKLVVCAAVLHNLCLNHGDTMEEEDLDGNQPPQDLPDAADGPNQEGRRQQLLRHFM